MGRKAFFSFEYGDVARAMIVRNSWVVQGSEKAGFIDKADFEALERQGDAAVKRWIDGQLHGTSVTVVLVGANTCSSRWVNYEIEQSKARGNGLLGIDVSHVPHFNDPPTRCCGELPAGYPFYRWVRDDGYNNLGKWIEAAARAAGR